jgi:hypothetical protein
MMCAAYRTSRLTINAAADIVPAVSTRRMLFLDYRSNAGAVVWALV